MRSYRGPNSSQPTADADDASGILGAAQLAWLKQRLAASTATWKVIASDMPLGLVVTGHAADFEAVANGDAGPPLGRELEIADLLHFIRDRKIRNVVFITADVHYAAAHYYDPARAALPRLRRRSGNSSPARPTPARSAPNRSTRRSVPKCASSAFRPA